MDQHGVPVVGCVRQQWSYAFGFVPACPARDREHQKAPKHLECLLQDPIRTPLPQVVGSLPLRRSLCSGRSTQGSPHPAAVPRKGRCQALASESSRGSGSEFGGESWEGYEAFAHLGEELVSISVAVGAHLHPIAFDFRFDQILSIETPCFVAIAILVLPLAIFVFL
jgi:hypothetical protein